MAAVGRLTRALSQERASVLATEAINLAKSGRLDQAATRLREAAALDHGNHDVQAAFIAIHEGQSTSPLIDQCRRYAHYHNNQAGEDAVRYLRSSQAAGLSSAAAVECLNLILEEPADKLSSYQDAIISELARSTFHIRQYLVTRLIESTTEFFENMFARGDDSATVLRSIVLEAKLWPCEDVRYRVENDLFVLFIAKLMESGHDFDGRALKGITLLLLADTGRLYHHIDEDAFDALLTSLDFRLPADVRGQATLVITKYMEVAELEAQKYFSTFVTSQVAKSKAEGLIIAFSAAAQLFPVASNITAQLFLTQGFLQGLMPLLQQKFGNQMVHDSFLALINAACIDGACRKAIYENCSTWLSHKVSNGTGRQPAMAATVLAKLRTSNARGAGNKNADDVANENVSDLVDLFQKSLVVEDSSTSSSDPNLAETDGNISDSIEGLAYTSLRSEVKAQLASNTKLLKALLEALEDNPTNPEITIGGLSIISNLTHYQPNLSEEQKRMSQLKAYANASKIHAGISELEEDAQVEKRCTALVKAGVTSTLIKINKTPSSATQQLTDKILLSLSRNKNDRGTIAQQGAVRLLITHCQPREQSSHRVLPSPSTDATSSPDNAQKKQISSDAAHALARILISLNPSHVFPAGATPNITSAIPPLAHLIKPASSDGPTFSESNSGPRDLLPVFESLLALTNLASHPNPDVASSIVRQCFSSVEDLLLSTSHDAVRRAAVELICNLVAYPAGILLYADGSRRALERLRILVAMADVEDRGTRSAAGGGLAMLTDYEEVRKILVEDQEKVSRTVEVILEMVGDEDTGIKHRGFVVLSNLLGSEQGRGAEVMKICNDQDGIEQVKMALREVREQDVLAIGVDVLKLLMGKE